MAFDQALIFDAFWNLAEMKPSPRRQLRVPFGGSRAALYELFHFPGSEAAGVLVRANKDFDPLVSTSEVLRCRPTPKLPEVA